MAADAKMLKDQSILSSLGNSLDKQSSKQRNCPKPPSTSANTEASEGKKSRQSYRQSYRHELLTRKYSVYQTLGTGSYSKVKLGFDFTNNRQVAIKIVDKHRAPLDYQLRFLPRELEIWPQFQHPNLTQTSQFVYMILQYSSRGDMLAFVQHNGALPEPTARDWFTQVVRAIEHMHEENAAHRDIKLENILLDHDSTIRVCDFGFTKICGKSDLSRTYCGSKSYASPEILMGKPYDPFKSDVWALGVILYIFVTGKMPFDESKGTRKILEDQRFLCHIYWPRRRPISESCKDLILWTFTWRFDERPTVKDLLEHPWMLGKQTMPRRRDPSREVPPPTAHPTGGREKHISERRSRCITRVRSDTRLNGNVRKEMAAQNATYHNSGHTTMDVERMLQF